MLFTELVERQMDWGQNRAPVFAIIARAEALEMEVSRKAGKKGAMVAKPILRPHPPPAFTSRPLRFKLCGHCVKLPTYQISALTARGLT